MDELIKKIDVMLETIYAHEKTFIEELDLENDCQSIQDISNDEIIELGYGWQTLRDFEYIEEKKTILVELKKQAVILQNNDDSKAVHRAHKALEEIIKDARGYKKSKQEYMVILQESIDVLNSIINISKEISSSKG